MSLVMKNEVIMIRKVFIHKNQMRVLNNYFQINKKD